ncbi:MAG: fluoroquinolone resistance protein [Cellvibrionaceae bacterium]|jgi:fluoroquinolone resistance protein
MTILESYNDYDDKILNDLTLESGQVHETTFTDCTFKHCNLRETEFITCRFNDCTFEDCDLSLMTVENCSFREVEFKDSRVVGVNWISADWPRISSGSPVNFFDCIIDYSTFIGLKLNKISFKGCSAKDVEFSETNLTSADFRDTTLTSSRFNNTNLTQANFVGAKDYSIDITRNIAKKTKFSVPEAYSLVYSLEDIILVE